MNPALQQGAPAAGQPGAGAPGAAGEKGPSGFYVGQALPSPTGEAVAPQAPPEFHVVEKGDTLWDLSNTYFGNPWSWPRIWSYNPSITNPHWIFPGQRIRLYIPAAPPPPRPTVEEAPPPEVVPPEIVSVPQEVFVQEGQLEQAAVLIGSASAKKMLSTGDVAYAQVAPQNPLVAGGPAYPVYKVDIEVKDPATGARLGYLVQVVGAMAVDRVQGNGIARGVLTATDPVERGLRVGPVPPQQESVAPVEDDRDLGAQVVAAQHGLKLMGAYQVVVLDRGSDDGVKVGNRFVAYRQGDQYVSGLGMDRDLRLRAPYDEAFPKEDHAELLVINVSPHTAVAYVTHSIQEMEEGERAEMRRGY